MMIELLLGFWLLFDNLTDSALSSDSKDLH